MKRFNHTKIIATVGPASNTKEVLKEMVETGVNVFRFNFSHGDYDEYVKLLEYIIEINEELESNVSILADLQGPKIRVGEMKDGVELKTGAEIIMTTKECIGTSSKVFINYKDFVKDINHGERILLDDGKLEMEVLETNGDDEVKLKIIYGGVLSSRKGVNLPNTRVSLPSMTEKDHEDLKFAMENNFNWIALSFVREASDIEELREILEENNCKARIIAKIEKPAAVDNLHDIIAVSDAIMIARGDLGVELPIDQLPLIQKHIATICILSSKPVIVATQIMENMIEYPNPTRAEVTDVATVVSEGADALMLSGETSIGKYPVKVIETIGKILESVEKDETNYMDYQGINKWNHLPLPNSDTFVSDAICYNACTLAVKVEASAIIGMTISGYTAYKVSSYRPQTPIFIFTANKDLLNTLSLVWGVRTFYYDKFQSTDNTMKEVQETLKNKGVVSVGDRVVNTASMPIHEKGRTNMVKVSVVE